MPLIKDGAVAEDSWTTVGEDDPIPGGKAVIVGLTRWKDSADDLSGHNGPLGIRLKSDEPPELIATDLGRFDLVALEFPNFNDGRAFSYARLLRERYRFTGEIRAVGDVLQDQLFFMRRCGFDSLELKEGRNVDTAIDALGDFTVAYQPASDEKDAPVKVRDWASN